MSEQERTCRLCNVAFATRDDLMLHVDQVHVEMMVSSDGGQMVLAGGVSDGGVMVCRQCQQTGVDMASMRDHVIAHTVESYACAVAGCDFKSTYARTLDLHEKYYHTTAGGVDPPEGTGPPAGDTPGGSGGRNSPVPSSVATQVATPPSAHTGSTPAAGQGFFACPICVDRAPFKYRRSYEKHLTQHAMGTLVCPMCNDSFIMHADLLTHT